jgi:hypothetical protein
MTGGRAMRARWINVERSYETVFIDEGWLMCLAPAGPGPWVIIVPFISPISALTRPRGETTPHVYET